MVTQPSNDLKLYRPAHNIIIGLSRTLSTCHMKWRNFHFLTAEFDNHPFQKRFMWLICFNFLYTITIPDSNKFGFTFNPKNCCGFGVPGASYVKGFYFF